MMGRRWAMATYEVTLRDVADSVAKLGERVDGRMDALASQITDLRSELSDLRSDVAGLRGEWRLAKWVLAVFGAPAWAAVIYTIVRDISSSA